MVMVDVADGEQIRGIVNSTSNQLICVYFNAIWSVPCELIDPYIDTFTVLFPFVNFLRITVHITPWLVPPNVRSIPTFYFIYNTVKVAEFVGNNPRRLVDHLYQLSRDPFSPVITEG